MNFAQQAQSRYDAIMATGAEKSFREEAWSAYLKLGLPDGKNEAWKYSNLNAFSKNQWKAAPSDPAVPAAVLALMQQWRSEFDIALMINGQFSNKDSPLTLHSGYELTRRNFNSGWCFDFDDGLMGLSAATHNGGFDLHVAAAVRPLLVIHCQTGEHSWSSSINRIYLSKGARLQLAEIFLGDAATYLRSDITWVQLDAGAEFTWVRTQEEAGGAVNFSEVQCDLAEDARLAMTQVNAGAQWARASLKVNLRGERAAAQINGLSFGLGQQHLDQRVHVRHWAAHTTSAQLFKGILRDRARGVLNGKIYIARGAQKVISSQFNHNLLLSAQAEADTKPELEIYADDVKAKHGATVGRLDDEKLFYLVTRGIPPDRAREMLAQAFVGDILMKIPRAQLASLAGARVTKLLPAFMESTI